MTRIFKPDSGQVLEIQDEGGSAALTIDTDGNTVIADGNRIQTDEVRAYDGAGLKLYDDAGAGIFVEDGGNVGIGTATPATALDFGATTAGDNVIHLRKNGNSVVGIGVGTGYGVKSFGPSDGGAANPLFETGTISTGDGTTFTQKGLCVTHAGNVGIATVSPGYTLDVDGNIGYSGTITDYSLRRLKEDIEELDGSGFIEKFKNIPLYRYRYKPKVSKEELKDLAFREFGAKVTDAVYWSENDELPENVKIGDVKTEAVWEWDKWDNIFPNGYGEGKMWDCPDPELKAFLDEKAGTLRVERRDDYHQKHYLQFGLIADDKELSENFPEVLGYRQFDDETRGDEIWGINPTAYIGMLHGVLKELVERVETLENA